MKFKGFTGIKTCPQGEVYRFKNGVAIVPDIRMYGCPVKITLGEFNKLKNIK